MIFNLLVIMNSPECLNKLISTTHCIGDGLMEETIVGNSCKFSAEAKMKMKNQEIIIINFKRRK